MKGSIKRWQIIGLLVTSIVGTLLHFLYEWLGEAAWIAPFSGVNESTWEHMKLLFWSMFLFSIVQSFFFKDRKDFWYVKLKGILLGLALIPIIFYTYNGAIGKSPSWFNITIFFITTAIVYIYETKEFNKNKMDNAGIDPATYRMQSDRSTIWANYPTKYWKIWAFEILYW